MCVGWCDVVLVFDGWVSGWYEWLMGKWNDVVVSCLVFWGIYVGDWSCGCVCWLEWSCLCGWDVVGVCVCVCVWLIGWGCVGVDVYVGNWCLDFYYCVWYVGGVYCGGLDGVVCDLVGYLCVEGVVVIVWCWCCGYVILKFVFVGDGMRFRKCISYVDVIWWFVDGDYEWVECCDGKWVVVMLEGWWLV